MQSLSYHKDLLRILELSLLVAIPTCLACMFTVLQVDATSAELRPILRVLLAVTFLTFGAAVHLVGEYASAMEGRKAPLTFRVSLSVDETKRCLRWCLRFLRWAMLLAIATALTSILATAVWRLDKQFVQSALFGQFSGLCTLLLIGLPVLASASRMPGTYLDNFAPDTVSDDISGR